jgi:hypothetical protein
MKKYSLLILLLALCSLTGKAQIGLKVTSDHYNNLIYNELKVKVRFENYTGNTLLFPADSAKPGLSFDIYDSRGNKVYPAKGFRDVVAGQTFKSARVVEATVDLSKFYTLQKADVYRCRAVISHPMLESDYMSKEIMFNLSNPPVRNSLAVGIPLQKGDKYIKKRNYNILIFESDGGAHYYLRIEDGKQVFKTVPLAVKRTNYQPQIQVDSSSNLHVFIYSNPQIFDYLIVDYKGRVLKHDKYRATGTRPLLSKDPDVGRVTVVGGIKAVEGDDYVTNEPKEVNPRYPRLNGADLADELTRGTTAESIFDRSERELNSLKKPEEIRSETKSGKSVFDVESEKNPKKKKSKTIFDQ